MSERLTIAAEPRTVIGKQVKQLRNNGWIPAVIYGRSEPVIIQLEAKPLRRLLRQTGSTQLLDVTLQGQTRTVLAREIQQHATRGDMIHIDFYEVDMKANITSDVELVLVNVKPSSDGVIVLDMTHLHIECLPEYLVSHIDVDASLIKSPDDVIHVADLTLPEGVEILADPELAVARFEWTLSAEAAEAQEAAYASVEGVGLVRKVEDED
jgi:large subunit ribosomal protein L25